MQKLRHEVKAARSAIFDLIEDLNRLLSKVQSNAREQEVCQKELTIYETNNEELMDNVGDTMHIIKCALYLFGLVIVSTFDCLLLINGGQIISERLNLPPITKWLFPFLLVSLEITVSYFQLHSRRSNRTKLANHLQYLVIFVVTAFTVITCAYAAAGYNSEFDKESFTGYYLARFIGQILLWIVSVFAHLWVIKNSEEIIMAITFLLFNNKRNSHRKKIRVHQNLDHGKYTPESKHKSQLLSQMLEDYRLRFSEFPVDFTSAVPSDLRRAIALVMGWDIFLPKGGFRNDKFINPNIES